MPMDYPPKICAVRPLAATRLFAVEAVDLLYANGTAVSFERLRGQGAGAVLVVPINAAGEVLLIREYACGTERYELGLPKGRIEAGEPILEAANRELQEEVGVAARRLTPVRTLTSAPAYSGQVTHIVLAEDLYPSRLPGDEPEPIEVVPQRFDALDRLAFDGNLTEARSIAALYLARAFCQQRGVAHG